MSYGVVYKICKLYKWIKCLKKCVACAVFVKAARNTNNIFPSIINDSNAKILDITSACIYIGQCHLENIFICHFNVAVDVRFSCALV